MFTRTERCVTAGCERITAAVSAEPVNETTSNGCSWSIRPPAEPQITDSAPAGSTPASTTSFTMRCVSQAVAVAGLTITGTPDSSAGAAFSHRPQLGKLNALMKSATPRVGYLHMLRLEQRVLAQARRPRRPSRCRRSPRVSPILA